MRKADDQNDETNDGAAGDAPKALPPGEAGVIAIYEPPGSGGGGGDEPPAEPPPPPGDEPPAEPEPTAEELTAELATLRHRDELIMDARRAMGVARDKWEAAKEVASRLKAFYEEAVEFLTATIDSSVEPMLPYATAEKKAKPEPPDDAWMDATLETMNGPAGPMTVSTLKALRDAGLDSYRKIGEWCQHRRLNDIAGIGPGKAETIQVALDAWGTKHVRIKPAAPKTKKAPKDESWRADPIEKLGLDNRVVVSLRLANILTLGELEDVRASDKGLLGVQGIGKIAVEKIEEVLENYWRHRKDSGEAQAA